MDSQNSIFFNRRAARTTTSARPFDLSHQISTLISTQPPHLYLRTLYLPPSRHQPLSLLLLSLLLLSSSAALRFLLLARADSSAPHTRPEETKGHSLLPILSMSSYLASSSHLLSSHLRHLASSSPPSYW